MNHQDLTSVPFIEVNNNGISQLGETCATSSLMNLLQPPLPPCHTLMSANYLAEPVASFAPPPLQTVPNDMPADSWSLQSIGDGQHMSSVPVECQYEENHPTKWNCAETFNWLQMAAAKYGCHINFQQYANINGEDLIALTQEEWTQRDPHLGMVLYRDLHTQFGQLQFEFVHPNDAVPLGISDAEFACVGLIFDPDDDFDGIPVDLEQPPQHLADSSSYTSDSSCSSPEPPQRMFTPPPVAQPRRDKEIHLSYGQENGSKKRLMLWMFLLRSLENPDLNPAAITWIDKSQGLFRVVNSKHISRAWGMSGPNPKPGMGWDNMSRSVRWSQKRGYLGWAPRSTQYKKKLSFIFGENAKWKQYLSSFPNNF